MKYLYGAAVQGIQNFIFQTNELKDIVGASELVENICTELFAKLLYGDSLNREQLIKKLESDENAIVNAAGNIKYEFDENEKEKCKEIVRKFPKTVVEYAPGITISQAVVEMNEEDNFADVVNVLEEKLRAQRNKPMASTTIGLMGILRSRKTGLPAVEIVKDKDSGKDDYIDEGTRAKRRNISNHNTNEQTLPKLCHKAFDEKNIKASQIAYNIEDLTGKNDWIAVIHADGNGLGQVVQKIGKEDKVFKGFSKNLDKATREAARKAYTSLKDKHTWGKVIPIRPIVLGGDDFTVICRADLALDYATAFIQNFEKQTGTLLGQTLIKHSVFDDKSQKLTACAGIAYIKSSYPFYYGYDLAESLCTVAKKDAKKGDPEVKNLPPSCIMFHKVQDSFVEKYKDIAERELEPQDGISFQFGPYYIDKDAAAKKDRWTVETLVKKVGELKGKEGNAIKSQIRNWLGLLHSNRDMAEQKLKRLMSITPEHQQDFVKSITTGVIHKEKEKEVEKDVTTYPAYDILAIHTINTQETKKSKDEQL